MSEKLKKILDHASFAIVLVALAITIYGFIISQHSLGQYRDAIEQYRAREQQYERAFAESREQVKSAVEDNHRIGECLDRQLHSITELRTTLSELREYYTEMENRLSELSSIYGDFDNNSNSEIKLMEDGIDDKECTE